MTNVDRNILFKEGTNFIMLIKSHFDSYKKGLGKKTIKMFEFFLLTTYVMFHPSQSAFLWVPTVLLFLLTCSFIRMNHIMWGFSGKTKIR